MPSFQNFTTTKCETVSRQAGFMPIFNSRLASLATMCPNNNMGDCCIGEYNVKLGSTNGALLTLPSSFGPIVLKVVASSVWFLDKAWRESSLDPKAALPFATTSGLMV